MSWMKWMCINNIYHEPKHVLLVLFTLFFITDVAYAFKSLAANM